jgi:hypothetical protein
MSTRPSRVAAGAVSRIKKAAWLEFRVAKGYSEGAILEGWTQSRGEIPGWFVAHELGFAWESGPSIIATMQQLDAAGDRRRPRAEKRETATQRQARLRAILARAVAA